MKKDYIKDKLWELKYREISVNDMVNIIDKEIEEARERGREEAVNDFMKPGGLPYFQKAVESIDKIRLKKSIEKYKKELEKEINEMKKKISQDVEDCYTQAEYEDIIKEGYNEALQDILNIIKNK